MPNRHESQDTSRPHYRSGNNHPLATAALFTLVLMAQCAPAAGGADPGLSDCIQTAQQLEASRQFCTTTQAHPWNVAINSKMSAKCHDIPVIHCDCGDTDSRNGRQCTNARAFENYGAKMFLITQFKPIKEEFQSWLDSAAIDRRMQEQREAVEKMGGAGRPNGLQTAEQKRLGRVKAAEEAHATIGLIDEYMGGKLDHLNPRYQEAVDYFLKDPEAILLIVPDKRHDMRIFHGYWDSKLRKFRQEANTLHAIRKIISDYLKECEGQCAPQDQDNRWIHQFYPNYQEECAVEAQKHRRVYDPEAVDRKAKNFLELMKANEKYIPVALEIIIECALGNYDPAITKHARDLLFAIKDGVAGPTHIANELAYLIELAELKGVDYAKLIARLDETSLGLLNTGHSAIASGRRIISSIHQHDNLCGPFPVGLKVLCSPQGLCGLSDSIAAEIGGAKSDFKSVDTQLKALGPIESAQDVRRLFMSGGEYIGEPYIGDSPVNPLIRVLPGGQETALAKFRLCASSNSTKISYYQELQTPVYTAVLKDQSMVAYSPTSENGDSVIVIGHMPSWISTDTVEFRFRQPEPEKTGAAKTEQEVDAEIGQLRQEFAEGYAKLTEEEKKKMDELI